MSPDIRTGRFVPGLIALGICLMFIACIAGCAQKSEPPAATPPENAGMANPASVYCGQIGGTLEIRKDAGGDYGMCTFKNGTSCDEWALYRGEGCRAEEAPAVTTSAEEKKMVTFTDADNGTTQEITQGTKFAVRLNENPTTGFRWNATLSPGLELFSDEFATDAHAGGMVGVGGVRTWIVLAKETGNQKFAAVYKRSWEQTAGNETAFAITVNVVRA